MTLDTVGKTMGYPTAAAHKSAWQFLDKTNDPHLAMLRKFAEAAGALFKDR